MKTLIDIKELAKTMTREEFLKKYIGECFIDYQGDCLGNHRWNCKQCLTNYIKDIKFKDDLEGEKVSKELNILEAMKMPVGTEFEVKYANGYYAEENIILKESIDGYKYLDWVNNRDLKVFEFLFTEATFIPIQQPVSFMEAVEAYSKGKTIRSERDQYIHTYKSYGNKQYLRNEDNHPITIKEILDSKWYIEESEADSNDIR